MASQPDDNTLWLQSDLQADAIRTGTVALHAAYWLAYPVEMRQRFMRGEALPPPKMPAPPMRLASILNSGAPHIPSFGRELVTSVAQFFGFTIAEITGQSRCSTYVDARSVIVQILRKRGWSAPQIGRLLNRDHTTILNLLDKFEIYQSRSDFARRCYAQLKHLAIPRDAPIIPKHHSRLTGSPDSQGGEGG